MSAAAVDSNRRASIGWLALALASAVGWACALALATLLVGCPHPGPRVQAFESGVQSKCAGVLTSVGGDVVNQAIASAQGAPGAPTWGSFAIGELVSKGVDAAICIAEQALAAIDMKLPAAAAADAWGNVPASSVARTEARGFYAPAPTLTVDQASNAIAHARLVDFLNSHGVPHVHGGADGGAP